VNQKDGGSTRQEGHGPMTRQPRYAEFTRLHLIFVMQVDVFQFHDSIGQLVRFQHQHALRQHVGNGISSR